MKKSDKELIAIMFLFLFMFLFILLFIYSMVNLDKTKISVFIDIWHLWFVDVSFLLISVNMLKK